MRGGFARFGGELEALARDGEIARPDPPIHIDRPDDAIRFPDAVPRGFVEPSQSFVRVGLDLETARKKRLHIFLRKLGVARRSRVAPLRDPSAQRAVQEHQPKAELRLGVVAL